MQSDTQLRQSIREAIVFRLEELKEEAEHWLNELTKLDHPKSEIREAQVPNSAQSEERPRPRVVGRS